MAKATTENSMTKMEAVRRALSDLGKGAMPKQLQPYIREKLGVEMSVDHVSTYKSQILRKEGKKGRPAKVSVNGAAPPAPAVPAVKAAPKPAATSLSEHVAMLKQVAGAIGKEEAKKILDLL